MSPKIAKGGKEARLKEGGGGGRGGGQKGWPYRRLLPPADTRALRDFSLGFQKRETRDNAGTHKHREPKTNTRTDKHQPTTQRWVFRAPEFSCPPGTRFTLPNGVHCSPDSGSGEELPFPQSRQPSSVLAGLGPAPAGTSSPFPLL